jgi:hypothetical protein
MAAFLIETDKGDEGGAHYMVTFIYDRLFQVFFKTLDVEIINNFS